jgi:hypothetical protein
MAQTRVPQRRRNSNTSEDAGHGRRSQLIETLTAVTFKEYVLGGSVLDKKIKRVKFNKDIIVTSEFFFAMRVSFLTDKRLFVTEGTRRTLRSCKV